MITDKDIAEAEIIVNAIKAGRSVKDIAFRVSEVRTESAEQARKEHEKEMLDAIKERDDAEDFVDKILDLLDVEHEWSNAFGYDDAYREAEASLDQISIYSAYKARQQARKEAADKAKEWVIGYFKDAAGLCFDTLYEAILGETVKEGKTDAEKLAIAVKALERIRDKNDKLLKVSKHHFCDYKDCAMSNYQISINALKKIQ